MPRSAAVPSQAHTESIWVGVQPWTETFGKQQMVFSSTLWFWLTVYHGKWPIEIDDFPSELNLHFWLGFSMAMWNNQMVKLSEASYFLCIPNLNPWKKPILNLTSGLSQKKALRMRPDGHHPAATTPPPVWFSVKNLRGVCFRRFFKAMQVERHTQHVSFRWEIIYLYGCVEF